MGLATTLRLGATNIFRDLHEARSEGLLNLLTAVDVLRFRSAQFYGTYRGYAQQGPVPELLSRRFYYPSPSSAGNPPTSTDAPGRVIDYDEPTLVS